MCRKEDGCTRGESVTEDCFLYKVVNEGVYYKILFEYTLVGSEEVSFEDL